VLGGNGELGIELHLMSSVDDSARDLGTNALDGLQIDFAGGEDGSRIAKALQQPAAEDRADVGRERKEDLSEGVFVERRLGEEKRRTWLRLTIASDFATKTMFPPVPSP
jgi:aryl-alcohol dehydrogenase-like predicted oxidoreductase